MRRLGLIVRPGTAEDVEKIAELIEQVDRDRFDRSETEWAAVRERLREILGSEETVTFVAEEEGDLDGELLAVPRAPGVVGIGVSVAEGRRRKGVATALFAAAAVWARDARIRELQLDVQEANQPARSLYGKLGFIDTGQRRPGERGPVLTMTKSL